MSRPTRANATALGEHAPTTEKPPTPSVEPTTEYVVTVNNLTGMLSKVEKLEISTGKRTELSEAEYISALGHKSPDAYADHLFAQIQLYYKGLSDYMTGVERLERSIR